MSSPLVTSWPYPDPCIITSVLLFLIALYRIRVKRHDIERIAVVLFVASIASMVYRIDRKWRGQPNSALFYIDLMCAISLFMTYFSDMSSAHEVFMVITVLLLFLSSWSVHFAGKPGVACCICVVAHVVSVLFACCFFILRDNA